MDQARQHDSLQPGMKGPLHGIRVVEAGLYAAGPACAAVLADWGADVIKVEPPGGESARQAGPLSQNEGAVSPRDHELNARHMLHNHGKRGVALDLKSEPGREAMRRLLSSADVFVTNMRPKALEALGLDYAHVGAELPRLVYAQITAYGLGHESENIPSYDHGAFWSRSGAASLLQFPGSEPPQPAGGMGDRVAGSILAGGVAAALYSRDRTGNGQFVTASLLGTGLWMIGSDVSDALALGAVQRGPTRNEAPIPTLNSFKTRDDQWFWLMLMEPERHWRRLIDGLGFKDLDDPKFGGGEKRALLRHAAEVVQVLDRSFAAEDLAYWEAQFEQHGVWYAPVRTVEDALADGLTERSGALIPVEGGKGLRLVDTPCCFGDFVRHSITPAPFPGEHTDEVLKEVGYSDVEVAGFLPP